MLTGNEDYARIRVPLAERVRLIPSIGRLDDGD